METETFVEANKPAKTEEAEIARQFMEGHYMEAEEKKKENRILVLLRLEATD